MRSTSISSSVSSIGWRTCERGQRSQRDPGRSEHAVRASLALARCCLVVAVAMTLAFVQKRAEIAILAVPFALAPALFLGRHDVATHVRLRLSEALATEHDLVTAVVEISTPIAIDVCNITLDPGNLVPVGPTSWLLSLDAGDEREIACELEATRWGRRFAGPASLTGVSPALLSEVPASKSAVVRLTVVPAADSLRASEDAPHALVSAGSHRSAISGSGATFSHVRPFDSGDRLRRINWRATLKAQQLHVTATHAERSAKVLIGVDVSRDIGPLGASILDLSVRAAAAIAEHYTENGDIVGVTELRANGRMLRAAPGQRQEQRIREWLLDVRPSGVQRDSAATEWFAGVRISNALVVTLTPLLDNDAAASLLMLRQRGAALVVVDTLSDAAQPEASDRVSEVARRLWVLERRRVMLRLGDAGIPVVAWTSTSSLEGVLRDVARIAAAPRLVNR